MDRDNKADDSDSETTANESTPADIMDPFDWNDLYSRYNKQMKDFQNRENEIWEDFNRLSNVWRP